MRSIISAISSAAMLSVLSLASRRGVMGMSTSASASSSSSSKTSMMMKKRILVTGGNKGIGKAICARLLTEWDDTIVILGARDESRGKQAIQDLQQECGLSDESCQERLKFLQIDTSNDESVAQAAKQLPTACGIENDEKKTPSLYGIINNAGIMGRDGSFTREEVINVNYFGVRRVIEQFEPQLIKKTTQQQQQQQQQQSESSSNNNDNNNIAGRIINIASAGGPNYVSRLTEIDPLRETLGQPWKALKKQLSRSSSSSNDNTDNNDTEIQAATQKAIEDLDKIAEYIQGDSYGSSKALVNAFTYLYAKQKDSDGILVNSVTPGWIMTDMTKGSAASGTTEKGAIPPCWLLMDDEFIPNEPTGRYYGSDCIRSPMDVYRGPGDAPYVSNDDLLLESTATIVD